MIDAGFDFAEIERFDDGYVCRREGVMIDQHLRVNRIDRRNIDPEQFHFPFFQPLRHIARDHRDCFGKNLRIRPDTGFKQKSGRRIRRRADVGNRDLAVLPVCKTIR